MNWLTTFIRPKIRSLVKKNLPDTLWQQCSSCNQMVFEKNLIENLYVCPHCDYHMKCGFTQRFSQIFEEESYEILPRLMVVKDALSFKDEKKYTDRLKENRLKTQQEDTCTTAYGYVNGHGLVVVCFNFDFIGGSMGMAAGDTIMQAAHLALKHKAPLLIIPASGGARMQEGIMALMQMPRTTLAMMLLKEAHLLTMILMTNPTTGGVAASFASLGDIIMAEPGAIIGFTGPRVIQQTLKQPLPHGFQTAEFQKKHGFIDMIVERKNLRHTLVRILSFFSTVGGHEAQSS